MPGPRSEEGRGGREPPTVLPVGRRRGSDCGARGAEVHGGVIGARGAHAPGADPWRRGCGGRGVVRAGSLEPPGRHEGDGFEAIFEGQRRKRSMSARSG